MAFGIKKYFSKSLRLIGYFVRQRILPADARSSRRDKIVFVLPNMDVITGGVMSIVNMYNIARRLHPDKDVYLTVAARYQTCDRLTKVKCDAPIINLNNFIRGWVRNGDRLLIHVYEGGCENLFKQLEGKGVLGRLKNTTLNILNQNQDLMPEATLFRRFTPYFGKVTMTLAFKGNEKLEYPYLSEKQMHVGAWFEGASPRPVPYVEKENLCMVSPDYNPFKERIVNALKAKGVTVFDNYPIPFQEFVSLQQRAKWTISFGEGWDGYTAGQFRNGGIGFGVYQSNFSQSYIDKDNLPPFFFKSYEEMADKIVGVIESLDNAESFDSLNREMRGKINADPATNTEEKVAERWREYYRRQGMLS